MEEITKDQMSDLVYVKLQENGEVDGSDYVNGVDPVGNTELVEVADDLFGEGEIAFQIIEEINENGNNVVMAVKDFQVGNFAYKIILYEEEAVINEPDDIVAFLFECQQRCEVLSACTLPLTEVFGG